MLMVDFQQLNLDRRKMTEKKYLETHEWYLLTDNTITIGISDYAQGELGDIVYVDISALGKALAAEEVFGSVEAVKTVSDLFFARGYGPIANSIS